jgi:hypothetical protein
MTAEPTLMIRKAGGVLHRELSNEHSSSLERIVSGCTHVSVILKI